MHETTEKDDDHGIRLFGRKIPLPECRIKDACSSTKKTEAENNSEQQENSSSSDENHPTKPMEDDNIVIDEDKILKKPDKILQCPRCNSLDTKFCYFNNYNVNQPRHFCKNCQRYWTAGGTMRNVPIGAGRRKNKHLASQYRQQQQIIVTTSDGNIPFPTEAVVVSSSTSSHHQHTNGAAVLKFGPDMPICESMEESMLNLRDQKRYASIADATSNVDQYKKEEPSLCVSSVTNSSTQGNESSEHNWLQCYPVPPWVVPWNPTWKNIATTTTTAAIPYSTNHHTAMQWCPTPMLPIQGISPPLQQLVSAPYWSGGALLIGGGSAVCPSASSSISTTCFNGCTILGKHTRDTTFLTDEEGMLDKSVLVHTKTIRIDDKDIEASKSPITATLLH